MNDNRNFCSGCGAPLEPIDSFCGECGHPVSAEPDHKLGAVPHPPSEPEPEPKAVPSSPSETVPEPPPQPRKKSVLLWVILCTIGIFLVLAGISAYFWRMEKKQPLVSNKQIAEDLAYALAKSSAEQGFFIYRELKKLPTLKRLLSIAQEAQRTAKVENYRRRRTEVYENIEQALYSYSESFKQLNNVDQTSAQNGFDRYKKFLLKHNAAEQLQILKVVKDHFNAFQKSQLADTEKWKRDFSQIG